MSILSISDIANAHENGGFHFQPFIKQYPSTYSTANAWWDMTMAGIFPRASYYPGDDYKFTLYPEGNHLSIFHGGDVSPKMKILRKLAVHGSAANVAQSKYILCDFLGFYTGVSWETNELSR